MATVTEFVIGVVTPAFTVTTTENELVDPGATMEFVQLMDPAVVQSHPAAGVIEKNVVLAENGSVNDAVLQLLGPLLVTTCV